MRDSGHRQESRCSSVGSESSSGKCHQSGSQSRDETGPKKGRQTPTEHWNSPGPVAGIARPTLDWSQGILEPRKSTWRPAAGDALATPRQSFKTILKSLEQPAPANGPGCCFVVLWW